jgi:hypothetical protein
MMLLLMQPKMIFAFLRTRTIQDAVTNSFHKTPRLFKGPEDTSNVQPIKEPEAAWALSQALGGLCRTWLLDRGWQRHREGWQWELSPVS